MKRVLIFSLAYYPHVGGAEVAIKEITDRILDIEFHMVTMRFSDKDSREEKIGNIFVHRIGNGSSKFHKFLFQLTAAGKAAFLHRRHPFDGIWAMMAHSSGVPAAIYTAIHRKVPYVLTLQEGDPPEEIERTMLPLWPLFARAFTRADVVQAISTFLGEWARRRGFSGPLEIIPNGVDIQRFLGQPIAHEGTMLITTSRLVHKNAVDDVIRALALLPETIQLQILGTGPDEVTLRELVRSHNLEKRVSFVGFVDNHSLPRYLHAADIFIRPSRSEGLGISFLEAMAAGLPVIATQEGGLKDFVSSETAWVVAKDHPDQIAQAVQNILANPEHTKEVVDTACAMVKQKYDWDLIAKDMKEKIFDRLL